MLSDVGRLRALRVVAEHRSFSRAADELGYTQSAVSQQIAALEHEVGLTLLNRAVRPVALTDAGRLLAGHVESVLEHLATAEAQLDAIRGLRAGRVRLAAFGSAYATFLPRAIAQFRGRHPDVQLELEEAEPDVSLPRLRRGEIDLAVVYRFGVSRGDDDDDGRLEATYLLDDEHRAVLPARHRLAGRAAVSVADLAEEAWIVPRPEGPARGYREGLQRLCADAGFAPRIAFETDDLQAVQTFVAAGLGIALMHDLTMPTRRQSIAVRPISGPRLTRPVHAVTVAGRRSPPAAAMLDVLSRGG
jgi:DNA-binding transcriptional LysR family regulator